VHQKTKKITVKVKHFDYNFVEITLRSLTLFLYLSPSLSMLSATHLGNVSFIQRLQTLFYYCHVFYTLTFFKFLL